MLPFGSITSIIPLFVLGFAYLLFLGTSAISKENTGTRKVFDDSKTITCNENPEIQKDNTCHWDSISSEACENETKHEYCFYSVVSKTRIRDEIACKDFFRKSFSIRPPPVLA